VWAAAGRIGCPLIVKPVAGAGSADTYQADSTADLDASEPAADCERGQPRIPLP
jgi:biotin carboxylase